MGTSASGTGPKGKTPLLPSWANGSDNPPAEDNNENNQQSEDSSNDTGDLKPKKEETQKLSGAKSILTRISNGRKGSSFKTFAKSYIKSSGGSRAVTNSSIAGINVGKNYLGFLSDVSGDGLNETLQKYNLSDCIGKSSEEVIAKIADRIAPIGSTNDEAIARAAIMIAFDKLYEKMLDSGKDIESFDSIDSETLSDTVVEFVSAYIFKKWVYEAGIALERNNLTEREAIKLENEMRFFIRDEVKNGFKKTEISKIDLAQGEGRKIIEDIFELAYSTLEK
ncbi:Qat anti-phage system associated protein QatB [Ulvibacterium marinum]|uniref:Qat anti-phage system associated protein QatB n=1 Tax=Ulvibacterium marinum TaxID=2419782 RepID=UPI0024944630|nr:Qat anti-phage system associated protein QatB [Ulvibacterium marinum]